MSQLQRLVVDYRNDELVIRALYRSSLDAPNPGTKARAREVSELTSEGLRQALAVLEGDTELVGCSGFATREDIIVATTSPAALETARQVKGA
jgi:hypothetical protein